MTQRQRKIVPLFLLCLILAGCTPWQAPGGPPPAVSEPGTAGIWESADGTKPETAGISETADELKPGTAGISETADESKPGTIGISESANISKSGSVGISVPANISGSDNLGISKDVDTVKSESPGMLASVDILESNSTEVWVSEPTGEPADTGFDFTICFAGDINLDENWYTTLFLNQQQGGIYDCISQELVEVMQEADIMCLNNEFTYSTGGSPLPGKAYTFRADPKRVEVLEQLGVDAVTLANNHVYDYGEEALLDTFTVLEEAGVPYFGAGRTLEDAMKPLYLEVGGKTVALVAASRAEKNKMTPQATDTEPGILRCYDTELFLQTIQEGKANADFCIAFVHWGTEYSYELERVQLKTGKEYLDAGADVVIGAHSHCLQGMEYYNGKPIIYSLGNYWFNEKTLDTMLLQLHFSGDDTQTQLEVQVIPAVQAECRTTYVSEAEEQRRIYDFLESISVNVEISNEGIVTEAWK